MVFDSFYDKHTYTSNIDCFIQVIKNESIQGLYKGLCVAFLNQAVDVCVRAVDVRVDRPRLQLIFSLVDPFDPFRLATPLYDSDSD